MLRWIRLQMLFEPRDMRAVLKIGSRRTYEDYEAGRRGIPEELAIRVRELYRMDEEFMGGIGDRVDAALRVEFPGGQFRSESIDE